ncbi:MAG: CAAX prenyl protease-related protein [Desulfuromonadales bacterium]|nr:CAAX prenyl protease-related protein [Desulfuromonadales bacterium]
MHKQQFVNAAFYRYVPFAVFMALIGVDEIIRFFAGQGLFQIDMTILYYLYPVKALTVGYLLYHYRREYQELEFKDLSNIPTTLAVSAVGLLVFFLWIHMDWAFSATSAPQGYNPTLLPGKNMQIIMTVFRVCGAVLVVPLMEELFWRSFLIRYIIDKDFDRVAIGAFTWVSFLITAVLFGLEHTYILAGLMAGTVYNLILYKTRSLSQCVLAHAVSNLALAVYVLYTGKWFFW